jgi:MOSC domain-containing protein YiiM
MFQGTIVSIHIAPEPMAAMQERAEVRVVFGRGLEGDRYYLGAGTFSNSPGAGREVTLIEAEAIEALEREKHISIRAGQARRNLVTRGVPLNHLVGREFQVGQVRLRGVRLCEPCAHMERLTREGALAGLIHRGGLRADIVTGGTIRVGDIITE